MTQNIVKNIIGNVASSYKANLVKGILNITENYINSHVFTCRHCVLNMRQVVGKFFFDWPDIFLIGRAWSKSEHVGKIRYEISYCTT